jgi:hypothetical protein
MGAKACVGAAGGGTCAAKGSTAAESKKSEGVLILRMRREDELRPDAS